MGMRCGHNGVIFGCPSNNGKRYFLSATAFKYGPWKHDKWQRASDVEALKANFADWDECARRQVSLLPNDGGMMIWSIWAMHVVLHSQMKQSVRANTHQLQLSLSPKDESPSSEIAAHASTPCPCAGAGQSIEDVLILEQLLGTKLVATNSTGNSI
ncbi:hypothetical protein DOTSEDRAFT_33722 [Dothistroma septosporum NZE10]|uniref:Uncharacterized protein n=1 Tax=Dothistroma septosporum (strain NZE10 / CBS 128990) TaxID=675120 RepID=N1PQD0_DOTSN|nr:hypothetical protein DOTSEDRAFT_33722 [Dothistroma septosporum NZE10]